MADIKQALHQLKTNITGSVVIPGDADYDETRKIWNAMIDRRPAAIIRCADSGDVQRSIAFAKNNRLELSIRGAGHNIAGNAVCNDGLMIDLSTMKIGRASCRERV